MFKEIFVLESSWDKEDSLTQAFCQCWCFHQHCSLQSTLR